mgnify:CR=1 FL=1
MPGKKSREVVHGVEQKRDEGGMNVSRDGMTWSKEEIAILREFYQKMPLEELAKKLPGRTLIAIKGAAGRYGVTKNRTKVDEFLTPEGLRRLKELVEKHRTVKGVAREIGVRAYTISCWRGTYAPIDNIFAEVLSKEKRKKPAPQTRDPLGDCAGCPYPRQIGRSKYGCYWPTCLRDDLASGLCQPGPLGRLGIVDNDYSGVMNHEPL